ncbi:MAG: winged helix-turn-helix domain-containing protein [Candidatus Thiodiazotropha lotti]|nr:winged helix-turn-helix domain-containing protein [Candidatus Thiodiazotropha lotti]
MQHTMRCRSDDPTSSQIAAINLSEKEVSRQGSLCLAAVTLAPGLSAREMANRFSLDYHMIARRLSEVEKMGLIKRGEMRRCKISNRTVQVWFPVVSDINKKTLKEVISHEQQKKKTLVG